jgi:outer membrane protein assembly factor BamB
MEPKPWYHSTGFIILASLLFPPAGLILLWTSKSTETQKKLLGSVGIVALIGVYAYTVSMWQGILPSMFLQNPNAEAHYDELERHRAAQRQTPSTEGEASSQTPSGENAASTASPSTATDPAATAANTNPAAPAVSTPATKASRNSWSEYRGTNRDGRYEDVKILTKWPSGGPRQLWKQPVGGGYASFVCADGLAFTIEQRRRQEVVAAYNVETGREVWTHGWDAEFRESAGGDGPRATPTWHEGRVYALGAQGDLRVLDAKTGKLIWSKNILSDARASNLQWGMSGSPLIVDDKVIVQPGGTSGKSVMAYNKNNGSIVWSSLNDSQAYVSPMLATIAGKRQIVVVTSSRMVGLEVDNGSMIWEQPWNTSNGINCSQPIQVGPNRLFISSGYGKGAALVEITGSGSEFAARTVWQNTFLRNKFNSSVFYDGHIYGLNDPGVLTCLDIETGQRKWQGGRYGFGQLVLADGHLIITTEEGEVVLARATPDQHTEIARFSALEGRTWNNPAIVSGKLLVRNATHMACYDISAD